jgi:hypothetical protein
MTSEIERPRGDIDAPGCAATMHSHPMHAANPFDLI